MYSLKEIEVMQKSALESYKFYRKLNDWGLAKYYNWKRGALRELKREIKP